MAPPRTTLTSLSGLTVVACALPSANVQTTAAPSSAPATIVEQHPADRKPSTRGRKGPVVLDAELADGGAKLHLQLSEPLGPTTGVDPNDFRISIAMAYAYRLYAYAYYYDGAELTADGEELMNITALHEHGDELDLVLDPPIDAGYCAEMEAEMAAEIRDVQSEPGVKVKGGLFLHYAPGDKPIVDQQGNAMAPIAAEWVLHRRRGGDDAYEMYFEGPRARRALRDAIPIRCGPPLPAGPH